MSTLPEKIVLNVEGMTCGGCVEAVKRVIRKVDPASAVEIDLSSGRVEALTIISAQDLAQVVSKSGYTAHPAT
ncbi:MAG: copper chaperone [Alphaproteobacteria bacterium]|jgi:copper chaperone|nr:heavy-metal-associated domain-containing protein [Beijerinckiaceae bacterium]NBQ40221.1 copper chaperone [Alphaproteobacteria bacterium]